MTQKITKEQLNFTPGGEIVDANWNSSRGFIRYENGVQEAWISSSAGNGPTSAHNANFYGDCNLGNWAAPFSDVLAVSGTTTNEWQWCHVFGWSNTSAGTARRWRSVSSSFAATVVVRAIGRWK